MRNLAERGDIAALRGALVGISASILGGGDIGDTAVLAGAMAGRKIARELLRASRPWWTDVVLSSVTAALVLSRLSSQELTRLWEMAFTASRATVSVIPALPPQQEILNQFYDSANHMPAWGVAAILGLMIVGPSAVRAGRAYVSSRQPCR